MVEGAATLMHMMYAMKASGAWRDERGVNILDTGAHFYDTYECADGGYVSIGSIEPQFYAELIRLTGLDQDYAGRGEELPHQMDKVRWDEMRERLAAIFRTRTRDEWCEVMEGTDVCFAPVLTMSEAIEHPHNIERGTFIEVAGIPQPAPAPRFSRTPGTVQRPPAHVGQHTDEILADWLGADASRIVDLRERGTIAG